MNHNPAGIYNPEDLSLKQIDLLIAHNNTSLRATEYGQRDCEKWLDSEQKQAAMLKFCEEMNTLLQWQVMLLTWRANIKSRETINAN